jgi:protein-S-isoprenylcysteine O-methyltransferase Ste14
LLLFLLVLAATLVRGRTVAESGVRAWAFFEARGIQRAAGLAFALSTAILVVATALLAAGAIECVPATLAAGAALMGIGAVVAVVAQRQMGKAWRVGVRAGDAPLFVTAGLFRFSRNPIFVGMIAMALGAALAAGVWWGWAAAIVFAVACHIQIGIEEAHLERAFGAYYDAFRRSTPRWLIW